MQDRKEDRTLKAAISLANLEIKNQQVQFPSTKEIIEENVTSADT